MRIVLLLPAENSTKLAVEVLVDSVRIAEGAASSRAPAPAKSAWSGVCKELTCRNISTRIGFIEKASVEALLDGNLQHFPLVCLVHNTRVVVHSDDLSLSGLEISLDVSQLHVFANLTLLERILGVAQYIKHECWWACWRLQRSALADASPEGISDFDAQALWKTAIFAVLKKVKSERKKFGGEQLRHSVDKLVKRRRYFTLYRRLLLSAVGGRQLCLPLDESEMRSLEHLEMSLCETDLLLCRCYVNKTAERCGVGKSALRSFVGDDMLYRRQQSHYLIGTR